MRKKLELEKVDNGFILTWVHCGKSALKEPYEGCKPVQVFVEFSKLTEYLNKCFNMDGTL